MGCGPGSIDIHCLGVPGRYFPQLGTVSMFANNHLEAAYHICKNYNLIGCFQMVVFQKRHTVLCRFREKLVWKSFDISNNCLFHLKSFPERNVCHCENWKKRNKFEGKGWQVKLFSTSNFARKVGYIFVYIEFAKCVRGNSVWIANSDNVLRTFFECRRGKRLLMQRTQRWNVSSSLCESQ